MKQETIENIKWLKDLLGREAEIESVCKNDEEFVSDYKKHCEECKKLLDSLEDLENQLKYGGFIPDRNGNPCKDGDKIEICLDGLRSGKIIHGHLCWNSSSFGFYALEDETKEYLYIDSNSGEVQWFEKEVCMGIEMFTGGSADIRMIEKDLYSVVIKSANGNQLAELKIDDNLKDSWYGFKVGDEEYDINIYSGELFGTGDAKWGATVYPVKNGLTDTEVYVQLSVKED